MLQFNGKVIVVTGGASGIGAAAAEMFVRGGGTVVVADKNLDAARSTASRVGGHAVQLDVGDEDSVKSAAQAIRLAHGAATILVNSAGILQRTLPPEELSISEWDRVQHIDLRGTYLCCAVLGGQMAASGNGGSIVNIASVAGMVSGPLHSYGPAKAAVISLTECLAAEWGGAGVRVNSVSPGFTLTPALERGIDHQVMAPDAMSGAAAMRRLLKPEEIAAGICFLASDLASGITGVNLPVDAGYLVGTPWAAYGGLRTLR
jgi:NAD(P)-dependent dehydrogenase (short-subunit alcohol dehydrogenase family)